MSELIIIDTIKGLKYICDEAIEETFYDEKNSTIRMTLNDWGKFVKKELER